jgi:hypothetical protein
MVLSSSQRASENFMARNPFFNEAPGMTPAPSAIKV